LLCTTISIDCYKISYLYLEEASIIGRTLSLKQSAHYLVLTVTRNLYGVGNFGINRKFWNIRVRVGHFTSDSATLLSMTKRKNRLTTSND